MKIKVSRFLLFVVLVFVLTYSNGLVSENQYDGSNNKVQRIAASAAYSEIFESQDEFTEKKSDSP